MKKLMLSSLVFLVTSSAWAAKLVPQTWICRAKAADQKIQSLQVILSPQVAEGSLKSSTGMTYPIVNIDASGQGEVTRLDQVALFHGDSGFLSELDSPPLTYVLIQTSKSEGEAQVVITHQGKATVDAFHCDVRTTQPF